MGRMKKLLLVLLVVLGLQTQAQINYCDSISYIFGIIFSSSIK